MEHLTIDFSYIARACATIGLWYFIGKYSGFEPAWSLFIPFLCTWCIWTGNKGDPGGA